MLPRAQLWQLRWYRRGEIAIRCCSCVTILASPTQEIFSASLARVSGAGVAGVASPIASTAAIAAQLLIISTLPDCAACECFAQPRPDSIAPLASPTQSNELLRHHPKLSKNAKSYSVRKPAIHGPRRRLRLLCAIAALTANPIW